MNTIDEIDFDEWRSNFLVLETECLILRESVISDADDLFVFRSDSYVQRDNSKPMENISHAKEAIERSRAIYLRQDEIGWAVTLKGQDSASVW